MSINEKGIFRFCIWVTRRIFPSRCIDKKKTEKVEKAVKLSGSFTNNVLEILNVGHSDLAGIKCMLLCEN